MAGDVTDEMAEPQHSTLEFRKAIGMAGSKACPFIDEDLNFRPEPVDCRTIAQAINQAYTRYGNTEDVEGALLWLALSLCAVKLSEEALEEALQWAQQEAQRLKDKRG